jgi:hypothetical protein
LPEKAVLKKRRRKLAHQRAFLAAYEKACCITWAVRAAGVTRKTHYRWLEQDSDYAAAFKRTQMIVGDTLESVAIERATVGWTEPVFYRGEKCGEVRKFDDAMLMFLLRALKPEVYGHRVQIQPPSVAAPAQRKLEVVYVSAKEAAARKNPFVQHQESGNSVRPEEDAAALAKQPQADRVLAGSLNGYAKPAQGVPDNPVEGRPELLARRILIRQQPPVPYDLRSWAL